MSEKNLNGLLEQMNVKLEEMEKALEEMKEAAHSQMLLLNENQIRILSGLKAQKKDLLAFSGFYRRSLWALGAVMLATLGLCLALFFRKGSGSGGLSKPASAISAPPASGHTAEKEMAILPPADRDEKEKTPAAVPQLLSPEKAERLIAVRADYTLTYLKRKELGRLALKYIHPEKGVHFLPFGLQAEGYRFTRELVKGALSDTTIYLWGKMEGRPLKMGFAQYYDSHIFDEDFSIDVEKQYNEVRFPGRSGLSAVAIAQKFPGCFFAEYSRPDKSLILVFEELPSDNNQYLSAVIHNH